MELLRPFAGLRPQADLIDEVVAPPYDVLNRAEAKEFVHTKANSFLHISKPEIDLDDSVSAYDASVYSKGRENLDRLIKQNVLQQDEQPSFYVYQLKTDTQQQTGLYAAISAAAYRDNLIVKHEFTRPDKEQDRVDLTLALDAQTSPVMLTYRSESSSDKLLHQATQEKPLYQVTADDGVQHNLWCVSDADDVAAINSAFNSLGKIYIADGHHRCAAGTRVADERDGDAYQYFLGVVFPHNELNILGYHRVIKDLADMAASELLEKISINFSVSPLAKAHEPVSHKNISMYLDGQWYDLEFTGSMKVDPITELPVSILHQHLIEPLFNIVDQRTDKRLDFVGGARGLQGLQQRVDSGDMAVAFALYPTSTEQLLAVADNQLVMPPKSTWFEPKLADGFVSMKY